MRAGVAVDYMILEDKQGGSYSFLHHFTTLTNKKTMILVIVLLDRCISMISGTGGMQSPSPQLAYIDI